MPSKKMKITGPGLLVNRHAKNSKIEIAFDPSPEGFVTAARRENARLKLIVVPGTGDVEPIEMTVSPKIWVFKFERAQIPPERLADLEALITEEQDVHVVLEYTPQQENLPFTAALDTPATANQEVATPDPIPDHIDLKFKGLRNCGCSINIVDRDGQWYAPYRIKVGNLEQGRGALELTGSPTRIEALQRAKSEIQCWCEEVEPSGSDDAKRSLKRRLVEVCDQIDQQIDPLLDRAERLTPGPDPVECEEDDDPELTADEDEEQDNEE